MAISESIPIIRPVIKPDIKSAGRYESMPKCETMKYDTVTCARLCAIPPVQDINVTENLFVRFISAITDRENKAPESA